MRLFVYIAVIMSVVTMLFATGCTGKAASEEDSVGDTLIDDSLEGDTLSVLIEEVPMPKSADELFDDFIFNFAGNAKVQRQRIQFPLLVENGTSVTKIERKDWQFDSFFMSQGFYTLVLGGVDELEASKDTGVDHVIVEKLHVAESSVSQYIFNRVNGLWKLRKISNVTLDSHPDGMFYSFCNQFMCDSVFRAEHMAESVEFSGPDPDDDFLRMEGFIMPEQVSMFAPEMPKGQIYNIIYGDSRPHGDERILVIRGIANGLEIELVFRKADNGYVLAKLVV